jgi:hypothetical protein
VKTEDQTVAAGHSIDPGRWLEAFEVAMGRIAGRIARVEPRLRAGRLVLGLLSDLPRKNCWTIAEWAGEKTPHGMQHLLCRASWDADAVRDDVREYVLEHLHDEAAVLVVDETGDVKKGTRTVGVQRQYTGTAGRIENSQVAVYLVYAGAHGHAAVDRELHVPRSWTADPPAVPGGRAARGHRLRDQAGAGPRDDRTVPGRRTPHRLGDRHPASCPTKTGPVIGHPGGR